MTAKKLSIAKTIKKYTNENGFSWGINTVMKSLAPNVEYNLIVFEGTYTIDKWNSTQTQPTSQEIRDEYIRQQTIADCLEHFKNINK